MGESQVVVAERLARTLREWQGEAGAAWLARLPEIVGECAARWSLTVQPPFAKLSFNYVTPVVQSDGRPAVLKVCFPTPEFAMELAALRLYDGRGACALLASDASLGAMLLERLEPGEMLVALADDAEATRIAARVMRGLWRPAPAEHSFPTVEQWGREFAGLRARFGGGTGPLPAALVEEAEARFAELAASMTERVVLHGDLQHYNILRARREPWLAIDPKGVVGEPAYEVGALLRNPWGWPPPVADPVQATARRLDILAEELALPRERLRGWGIAQAVLSAWWVIEDGGSHWGAAMGWAEVLRES